MSTKNAKIIYYYLCYTASRDRCCTHNVTNAVYASHMTHCVGYSDCPAWHCMHCGSKPWWFSLYDVLEASTWPPMGIHNTDCASRACHIVVWRAGQNFACTANALSASLIHPSSCCWPVGYICLHAWRLLETILRQFRYQACILHCIKRGVLQRACTSKFYDARLHHFEFTMLLAKKALNNPAVTCCNIASGIQAPCW